MAVAEVRRARLVGIMLQISFINYYIPTKYLHYAQFYSFYAAPTIIIA